MEQEGVIKFCCEHEYCLLEDIAHLKNKELYELFEKLDALRTKLFDRGYIGVNDEGIGYGNISLRMAFDETSQNHFLISSSGSGGVRELGLSGYSLVHAVDIEKNTIYSQGEKKASSESMSHAAIYMESARNFSAQANEFVQFVVHIHHAPLFNALCQEEDIPCTAKEVTYGSVEMAKAIMELMSKKPVENVILMRGHEEGILFYASTVDDLAHIFGL